MWGHGFIYGDKVQVVSGFYAGSVGRVLEKRGLWPLSFYFNQTGVAGLSDPSEGWYWWWRLRLVSRPNNQTKALARSTASSEGGEI